MTTRQEQDLAGRIAASVAIDLRVILIDAQRELSEFETYVESWEQQVDARKEDPATHDPRGLTEEYVITRALGMIEDVAHVHSGSTRMSNIRRARTRLIQLAQSAPHHRRAAV